MNHLLFCLIILVLLYYCYYLPSKKPIRPTPFTQSQSTQTEPDSIKATTEHQALEAHLDQLLKNIRELNRQLN